MASTWKNLRTLNQTKRVISNQSSKIRDQSPELTNQVSTIRLAPEARHTVARCACPERSRMVSAGTLSPAFKHRRCNTNSRLALLPLSLCPLCSSSVSSVLKLFPLTPQLPKQKRRELKSAPSNFRFPISILMPALQLLLLLPLRIQPVHVILKLRHLLRR